MILQSLKMAWKAIGANKLRTFLTMLGIIIGVVALVVLVSLVSSTTDTVTDSISNLGTNYLTVTISDDKGAPLRLSELSDFTEDGEISAVAPIANFSATAKYGYNSETATVYGSTPSYFDIQGLAVEYGRTLKTTDADNNSYVAVISQDTATEIFGGLNILGETLYLDGMPFTVVGILSSDDSLTSSFSSSSSADIRIYIPYTVAVRMSDSLSNTVTTFYASVTDEENMDAAEDTLTARLMERFGEDDEAFTVSNMNMLADTMSTVTDTLTLLLGGIAAISLLVGGIGIMNIMLVSVTERTKEIGIRKAIGAGRGNIMLQFLIEALVVSLMGCIVGILLSWIIILIATAVAGDTMTFHMSSGVVLVAVIFSVAIGVIFGIYPANQAAKKHPIQALRYDG